MALDIPTHKRLGLKEIPLLILVLYKIACEGLELTFLGVAVFDVVYYLGANVLGFGGGLTCVVHGLGIRFQKFGFQN